MNIIFEEGDGEEQRALARSTFVRNLRFACSEAFKPLLKRWPPFWDGFQNGDPDELGVKPVDGLVTGAQLKTIQDQAWKAAGFALDQGSLDQTNEADANKLYKITAIQFEFVSVEEGEC